MRFKQMLFFCVIVIFDITKVEFIKNAMTASRKEVNVWIP